MNLIKELNNDVKATTLEHETISENINKLSEVSESNFEQIDEAVTNWLVKLRSAVEKGSLDPAKKQNVAYMLGALMALSDPNIADAFDEKNDLGTLLYSVSGDDKAASQAAIQRLIQMGRNPSTKTYVAQAEQVLDDPQQTAQMVSKVQTKIDQVMRSKLSKERGAQGDQPEKQTNPSPKQA